MAAVEKMPEKDDALERFSTVAHEREFRDSFFAFGTNGQAVFPSGPFEGIAFEHARDSKSDVRTPRVELRRPEDLEQGENDVLRDVLGRKRRITASHLSRGRVQHGDKCEKQQIAETSIAALCGGL